MQGHRKYTNTPTTKRPRGAPNPHNHPAQATSSSQSGERGLFQLHFRSGFIPALGGGVLVFCVRLKGNWVFF